MAKIQNKKANGSKARALQRNSTISNDSHELLESSTCNNLDVWDGNPTTNNTATPATLYWRGEVHNDQENRHKFYEVIVNNSTVIRRWGRVPGYGIKSSPRKKMHELETDEVALAAAFKIIQNKIKSGYSEASVLSMEQLE